MKNKYYMLWNLSEKSLLLVIWYYAIISIQTSHYWDSRTFELRYNNNQREYLFQEFQRAHVLTHSRLIITLDSLQVSMRSLASKIRSHQNLNKWKHTDLWAIILVMLLHTDPAKQTEVQFPYVLFKAQLCHSPVQIREAACRWSCCSAYLVRNIFFCVLCPMFLHGKIISVLGLVLKFLLSNYKCFIKVYFPITYDPIQNCSKSSHTIRKVTCAKCYKSSSFCIPLCTGKNDRGASSHWKLLWMLESVRGNKQLLT